MKTKNIKSLIKSTVLATLMIGLLMAPGTASVYGEPELVLSTGSESWENVNVYEPSILYEDGTYKMWYRGRGTAKRGKIGYAESIDGVTWTNRQVVHSHGSGYKTFAAGPCVVKDGSEYKMFHYEYYIQRAGEWSHYIPLITSSNGINWGNEQTVLTGTGIDYNWEARDVHSPSVIKEAGMYTMWYCATEWHHPHEDYHPNSIGRAESADGINWINRTQVWEQSGPGDYIIYSPHVVKDATGVYSMYYASYVEGGTPEWVIERVQSIDGINWDWTDSELILENAGTPFYFEDASGIEYLYFNRDNSIWRTMMGEISPVMVTAQKIDKIIDRKIEIVGKINVLIGEEQTEYDALEEMLANGDYGDLNKCEIVKAKQKLHSAIQREERSIDKLEKSIEKLEDTLDALGWDID